MIQPVVTFTSLKKLEVIDICNGTRLGRVCNLEMDLNLGKVTALFVPRKGPFWTHFYRAEKYERRIPWCEIQRIGDDTILVRLSPEA